jgi:hypothetical protein
VRNSLGTCRTKSTRPRKRTPVPAPTPRSVHITRTDARVSSHRRPLRPLSPCAAKILRLLEFARPESAFGFSRHVFGCDVVLTVAAIRNRVALRYQPSVQILPAGSAHRHHAPIAVCVAANAVHHLQADLVGKGKGGLLSAAIGDLIATTPLATFGRVNAVNSDGYAVDFDAVAVND